jgi:hypothetical protein
MSAGLQFLSIKCRSLIQEQEPLMGPNIKGQHLGLHGSRKVLSPSLYPQHHGLWLEQDQEVRINMIRNKDQKSGCTDRVWNIRDISFGNQYEAYILHHFPKLFTFQIFWF